VSVFSPVTTEAPIEILRGFDSRRPARPIRTRWAVNGRRTKVGSEGDQLKRRASSFASLRSGRRGVLEGDQPASGLSPTIYASTPRFLACHIAR
jgi:hypothetical protein